MEKRFTRGTGLDIYSTVPLTTGPFDAVFLAAGPPLMASPGLPGSQPNRTKPIIKGLSRHKRPDLWNTLPQRFLLKSSFH